jgi:hypothetical protein
MADPPSPFTARPLVRGEDTRWFGERQTQICTLRLCTLYGTADSTFTKVFLIGSNC